MWSVASFENTEVKEEYSAGGFGFGFFSGCRKFGSGG